MRLVALTILLLILLGCRKNENKMTRLSSATTWIDFINALDPAGDLNIIKYLYYYNGGGVAVGDINNDGLEDLFFTANQGDDQLYLNTGDLQFRDITLTAGLTNDLSSWSNGVVFADVNGDGWEDIYISKVGDYLSLQGHNLLYLNNQDNTFTEVAKDVGVAFSGFSTHASFFDYDRDGDLDLYLMNHAVHTTRSYQEASTRQIPDPLAGDRLYRNQLIESDTLYFQDVTLEAGIFSSAQGYGLGLVTSDINQDGWMDIYVGNDFHEDDYLYLNQKDGTFKESRREMINHTSRFTMGVDIADVNGDTHPDIFSLDMLPRDEQILMKSGGEDNNKVTEVKLKFGYGHQYARNALQLNTGRGTFSEVALLTDTYATDWSWSVLLQDFDNDGHKDIFITNGIYKRPNDLDYINFLSTLDMTLVLENNQDSLDQVFIRRMPTLKIPNYMFRNTGDLGFEEVSTEWGMDEPSYSNGAAYADLDNDGDLELIINNVNAEPFIYQNNFGNHYLQVKLEGDSFNRQAVGATVRVWFGGREAVGEVVTSRGFQSASTKRLHFGLGSETTVDSLAVYWPDGTVQKMGPLSADSLYTISKESPDPIALTNNSQISLNYLEYNIVENDYRDYDKETLIPEKLSTEGPAAVAGDFNGDGLEDLFLGTPRGQHHQLFLQTKEGLKRENNTFVNSEQMEAVDAAAIDFEGDGDLDLYVVHGGNDYPYDSPYFEDALYLNDGLANFKQMELTLPSINGSCVAAGDYDDDGDIDLFVGGRSVPGGYGLIPESLLLENTGGTLRVARIFIPGMVTDAAWHDYEGDGDQDLYVVGDWMPVTIFRNDGNTDFKDITHDTGLEGSHGLWNNILITDLNKDGQKDLVLGNVGLNSKFKASPEQPVTLFLDDFDKNGQPDPIIFYYINGAKIPFASRDELTAQLPYLKKDFLSYEVFSGTRTLRGLTGKEEGDVVQVNHLYDLNSGVFLHQNDGKYIKQHFPLWAQFSPINDMLATDLDGDGIEDIIYVGNFFGAVTSVGRYDGSPGGILLGTGQGKYEFKGFLPLDFDREYREVVSLNNDKFVMVPNSGKPVLLDRKVLVELCKSFTGR